MHALVNSVISSTHLHGYCKYMWCICEFRKHRFSQGTFDGLVAIWNTTTQYSASNMALFKLPECPIGSTSFSFLYATRASVFQYIIIEKKAFKVDENAMIRNRYTRIQCPSPDTIRERNKSWMSSWIPCARLSTNCYKI